MTRPRSWTAILEALYADSWNAALGRFRSPFAFRGLGRTDHVMSSSLFRLAGGADTRRLEMALLRNFRKYAHVERATADSIWDWLALGQHRGLPTRLLDWTYSPLVALHFATENPAEFQQDGVIWCVNFVEANRQLPGRLRRIMQREGSETVTVDMLNSFGSLREFDALGRQRFLVFLEPPAVDRRILNQFALFSLMSSPTASMDDWMRAHPRLCRRVIIPKDLKWEIRDKLDQANVNERVLFPDLDGLSRWLTRYYLPTPAAPDPRPSRSRATIEKHEHAADLDAGHRNHPARRTGRSAARSSSRPRTRRT
jgi:hypothetical protein